VSTITRIVIADDQALVRGALASLLSLEPDIEVVGQVGRGDEVLDLVRKTGATVALLDVEMPGLDGLSVARLLRDAGTGCRSLIVTTFGRPGYLRRALESGASGFVVKDTPSDQLADAVRRVAAGLHVVDPSLATESLVTGKSPLSARETDVLLALRSEGSIADVALALRVSEGTVRNHLSAAIGKTHARNGSEAVRIAADNGWLIA
jgi:two-component system response regulator DesR